MKTKPAFNGVVILTLALITIKILSAIYRIPYQNVLGDSGLYAYQQVYPIVALGTILSMNAVPSAITQHLTTQQDRAYSKVLLRLQYFGSIIFLVILICAPWLARLMGDESLTPMLRTASLSFLFIGVLGVFRGIYQSKNDINIPAISQVVEQFIRVAIILITILVFSQYHWTIYQAGTLAILASSIGFLGSSIYLIWHKPLKLSFNHCLVKIEWKPLFTAIIIFALSQLIVILWQVIDSFTIIHTLQLAGIHFNQAIIEKGVYDRGASFIQMGLIVTTTFSFVLIPLLTDAVRTHNRVLMNRYANASLKITIVISTAAGIGLINLLPLMNRVFFKTDDLTGTLSIYMLTVICVSLIMMDIALLQIHNKIRPIIIGILAGLLAKLVLNIVLISSFGIVGASISTVVSLIVFGGIVHSAMIQYYNLRNMLTFILKLITGMVLMSVTVQLMMLLIVTHGRLTGLIELLASAIVGIIVLFIYIAVGRVLSYKELSYLPFGDKLYHLKKRRRK